jgi:hypothetical protein
MARHASGRRRGAVRFGCHDLIIQLALYPGELEAVIGANGSARAVSATYSHLVMITPSGRCAMT